MTPPPLSPHPGLKLSKLRDIGWRLWDPIGLLGKGGHLTGRWDDPGNLPFADEYDSDLIAAASMLRRDGGRDAAIEYLPWAETQTMCLSETPTTRSRPRRS